ncbi:hypothetical protein HPB48_010404 [Haemaphysalis longicornis]|uniref:CCHC-type domain-containing protein n=1 Tax=Haemaphysalis longicornis TaxID=44386 RepID=A0A9J6GZF0_HAELO|nr:hypothetical protein HPB48_010404 [Haemaphysalis longicornis]
MARVFADFEDVEFLWKSRTCNMEVLHEIMDDEEAKVVVSQTTIPSTPGANDVEELAAAMHFVTRSESEETAKETKDYRQGLRKKATIDEEMNEERGEDSADDGPWQDAHSRMRRRSRQTYRKVHAERTKASTDNGPHPPRKITPLRHNVSRGVITTDPNDTNEELRSVLRCATANVLEARQMGKSGRALLTFDSPVLPKRIKYYSELCKVTPYVARMLICYRCHGEGHMQKYCPNDEICSRCGTGHADKECDRQDKHCVTCKENGHLATDASCPEKGKRLKENKDRLERRSWSRSRRRTANSKMAQQDSQDLDSYPVLSGTMVSATPKAVSFANDKDSYASKACMGLHANIEGEIAALRKTIEEASRRLTQLLSHEISALVEAMQQAMILATQEIDLPEELPTPDKHMLNLWETREQLHAQYLANGRRYKDLLKCAKKLHR